MTHSKKDKHSQNEKDEATHQQLDAALEEMTEPAEQMARWQDKTTLLIQSEPYELNQNFKDAFDLEQFNERYIDHLANFDYIVGDISDKKLRLRGFYEPSRANVHQDQKIDQLSDYLLEDCNFGAPYFVLERAEKAETLPVEKEREEKKQRSRRNRRGRRGGRRRRRNRRRNRRQEQENKRQNKGNARHSFKKKASRSEKKTESASRGKASQRSSKSTGSRGQKKRNFKIRPLDS